MRIPCLWSRGCNALTVECTGFTRRLTAAPCRHSLVDECRVLLVHGVLHLLGHDHELGEREARAMAVQEQQILAALGWPVHFGSPLKLPAGACLPAPPPSSAGSCPCRARV